MLPVSCLLAKSLTVVSREDFRRYKSVTDPTKVSELLDYGRRELEVIQRQAQLSALYASPTRSVLEERKSRAAK